MMSADDGRARLRRAVAALRDLPDDLRILGRGIGLVVSAAPPAAVAYAALVLLFSTLPVAQVWLNKLVVDHVLAAAGGAPGAATGVLVLAALYAVTLALPAGLAPVQQTLFVWLQDRTTGAVDRQLMGAGTRLADLYRIEAPSFQDERRMVQRMWVLAAAVAMFVQQGPGLALTLGGLLLLMGSLHPLLPLALIVLSAPLLLNERRMERRQYELEMRQSRAGREMEYCVRTALEPQAAKEIRVFGLGDFFLRRYRDRFDAAHSESTRLRFREVRLLAAFRTLFGLALAGGFWYVAAEASAGRLTVGDLALYLSAVAQAQGRVMQFSEWFGGTYQLVLVLRTFFRFLDHARPTIALPPPGQGRTAPAGFRLGIALRHVRFRYPEGERDVLEDVTALLPAGGVTALVGPNGAGKSTLVKLLTRMYDPDEGEILLDGVPLREYDLDSLRRRIAVVYQDFARFALTLRENIVVGAFAIGGANGGGEHAALAARPMGAATSNTEYRIPDAVEQAARWAGADGVAAKLPHGYETQLTRRFEGGVDLSGGEWQKVALARGFVRDAALVILDEPTAALDAEAEYQLFLRFRELVTGKTALLISHRFSTVRMADHLLVLEGGRIVEAGSHAELVALGGRYATLFQMQAGRYR